MHHIEPGVTRPAIWLCMYVCMYNTRRRMQKRMYMYKIHDTDISYLQSLSHLQTPSTFLPEYTAPIPSFRVSGGKRWAHACMHNYIHIHIYIVVCGCWGKKGYPMIHTGTAGRTGSRKRSRILKKITKIKQAHRRKRKQM